MKRLLTSAAMFLCSLLTFAQFSGSGSGTESDPFLILNPIQLNQMRNYLNKSDVYFKLMADINLEEFIDDEYPSQGWQPVGNISVPFKGTLDGNGKKISGLWIKRNNSDYVGLFGYTDGAKIENCTLNILSVSGNDNIGLVSGFSKNTNINNCVINGKVHGNKIVGGCVGGTDGITLLNISISSDVSGGDYTGGCVGNASGSINVSNCSIINNQIQGDNYVGGICGKSTSNLNFKNCHVSSRIIGKDDVGGICGSAKSSEGDNNIIDCGFYGKIQANSLVGGIAGEYSGGYSYVLSGMYNGYPTMKNCFAIGDILAGGDNVGGLVGKAYAETWRDPYDYLHYTYCYTNTIASCYFNGTVKGYENTGGIVGFRNGGDIISCYSTGTISGNQFIGGICGKVENNGHTTLESNIANIVSITAISGNVGRIYGVNNATIGSMGTNKENKALNRTIVISHGIALEIMDDQQNGTGVSATTLKLKATYVAMGWDFNDIWEIQETECYPYFKWQTAPPMITSKVVSGATTISGKCVNGGLIKLEIDGNIQETTSSGNSFSFNVSPLQAGQEVRVSAKADGKEQSYYATEIVASLGSGKENDPYQVFTAADLISAYRKGYYKLMNDIDLTDYINQNSPSEGWQSIGRDGCETIHFDGDGHKITGLWCNTTRDNTGLFSCFANGTIKNLTVETAKGKQVKGGANTGILIGKMINGTIENCQVSGTVADGTPVGGIVGLFDGGKISLSQANVIINTTGANSYVGGLVGEITGGEIDQCVTLGTLTAIGKTSYVGGLVGKNSATVTNCYSNANVTSTYNAAGLIAYNYGVADKCYATGNISSNNYGAGIIGYNDGSKAVVKNCIATSNKIDVKYESQSAQSGGYGQRIIGGIKNGAPAPEMNNYALKYMQVSVNGIAQKVYDDIMNGVGKNGSDLVKGSTYQELGWNFSTIWNINEGNTYPSLKKNEAEVLKPGEDPIEVKVTAPTAKTGLIYNGSAQELVSAGSTNVGTLQYSLDGSSYSTAIPKGTDAKTYTVYYKAVDGSKDLTTAASLNVTIIPKTVSSPTITLSATSFVYDAKEKKPTVTVKDGNTTIPTSEYTVSYSNNVNVGTATVTITDKDGGNYVVSGSAQFTITSAAANVTAPKAKSGLVYNGNAQELITAGSSTSGEMQYSLDGSNYSTAIPKGTDAKTYTIYYRVKGDANHSDTEPATLTVTISPTLLKIKTGSYSKKQGEDNPVFILSYEGFVNNETEAVLTKKPIVTCQATKNSPVGEYDVIVSGAEAQNYDISYVNGKLTVTAGTYVLTYKVDGETYKTVNYVYGTTITPEAEPTKEGYTFSGWSEIPKTMPDKDITVTGTFTVNKYKLIYKVDDEVYKTYEVEYGTNITPEADPKKEGYTFSGWSYIPSKMLAEDVVVVGFFTQIAVVIDHVKYEIDGNNVYVTPDDNAKGEIKIEESVVINGQSYNVTAIAEGAFQECINLTSVEIPSSITTIGENAFEGCSGLTIIKIGKGIKEIGSKAFANIAKNVASTRGDNDGLKVYCEAEVIPSTAADAFENTPIDKGTLIVTDELVNVYKLVMPWNGFGSIIDFTTDIRSVAIESENAFIFDMQGNRLDNVRKGVNILRTKDGKIKKIMVK